MEHFLRALRATVKILEPFAQTKSPGSMTWDGSAYTKASASQPDPYALAWSSALAAIADLIERQPCPLSVEQLSYLRAELFGGMGSLLDFEIDEERFGDAGLTANKQLSEACGQLFEAFEKLEKESQIGN